jgi:hypothetical protein
MTDVVVTDGRSKDDDPRGGNRRATEAVDALDYGDGRGIAGATMTTRTTTTTTMTTTTTRRKQTSAPALATASAPTAAATMAIARRPSPKRWRIAGPSHESHRESSDGSAEGEDRRQRQRYWIERSQLLGFFGMKCRIVLAGKLHKRVM